MAVFRTSDELSGFTPAQTSGLIKFATATIAQVRVNDVYREVLPFFWALLGVLALVTYLPSISLWLPRLVGY